MRLDAEMFGLINTNEEKMPFERKYIHENYLKLTYRKKETKAGVSLSAWLTISECH
jgi:hypothetical protein